jgi:DDE family transposase
MTRRPEPKQFPGKVKEKLLTLFAPEQLETLAWQSRFIQRASSKLTGADFFALMTTDMLDNPAVSLGGLCDLLSRRHPAATMTPQALQQRMNTPEAVAYLQEVFQLALRDQLPPLYAQVPAALLASFGRVFLEDSTQCCLHEKLAEAFKGSGGSASRSTVKIDVIYELLAHHIYALTVTDGRAADQGLATTILAALRAGDLVIRDLGYFSIDVLQQIAAKDAWFLSRLSSKVAVYASAAATAEAVALVEHVQATVVQHGVGDFAVYLGADRLPCRLLAYRLPEEVVEQRRRQAYETARKKGRTPTHGYLHWLQYGWYITNVRAAIWAAEVVATVYRIRWQIELLFKQWKSLLHVHVLKGTRPERIRCLLYGRLITITMLMQVCSYAAWYASAVCHREVSFPKLLLWLKRQGRFAHAVQDSTLATLYADLRQAMEPLLCKQKRKRPTSQQLLDAPSPAYEKNTPRPMGREDQAA